MREVARRIGPAHGALLVWLAAFVAYSATAGLPTKRSNVIVWMVLAIVAVGIGRPRRTARALLVDWSPIILALVAYDLLRGLSDERGVLAHTAPQLPFDRWLGGGTIPTVHLQELLHQPGVARWFDYPAWGIYISHFLVPLGLAVVLWASSAERFRPYLYGLALLSWMALATYWIYPAQPPWMTGRNDLHEPVARIVHGMWNEVGVARAARVWEPSTSSGASRYANPVAALPSLHAAFPVFILCMMRGIDRRLTGLFAAYALAMGVVLVYAGEHFVFDVAVGWAYGAVAAMVMLFAAPRMRRRPVT